MLPRHHLPLANGCIRPIMNVVEQENDSAMSVETGAIQ